MNKALLPAGLHDLLAPEAGEYTRIISDLLHGFEKFGYSRVNPPIIEFEDSLFSGAGKALESSTFRLMDPNSHKMMGIRADITTQIARIATTRLQKQPMPLRLSYSGDVFRVAGEGLHAERQFTQAGIEMIGEDSVNADAEVIMLSIRNLGSIGIEDICIDFTMPKFIDSILDEIKVDDRKLLKAAISKKDIAQIAKITSLKLDLFEAMMRPNLNLDDLIKFELPVDAVNMCKRLQVVINIVKENYPNVQLSVDPMDSVKFAYHTDISFSFFSKNSKSEIARGGRYLIECESDNIPAVGSTFYVNDLFRILPKQPEKKKVFVPFGIKFQELENLQSDDVVMILANNNDGNLESEALKMGCNFLLKDGQLVSL